MIHSAVQPVGNFQCSNPLLNQIHRNFQWSILNNLMGIPTGDATRNERTPCQMDSMVAEETALYNFDMDSYYTKWLGDIEGGGWGERLILTGSGDQVFLPCCFMSTMAIIAFWRRATRIPSSWSVHLQLKPANRTPGRMRLATGVRRDKVAITRLFQRRGDRQYMPLLPRYACGFPNGCNFG